MTKILIEKVPEGVKVTITLDAVRKPVEFVLPPGQLTLLVTLLQQAARSETFRFEYQP